ncbi:MAG: transglycosylase SLT domain-containing protein [Bacteroidota bacterium]
MIPLKPFLRPWRTRLIAPVLIALTLVSCSEEPRRSTMGVDTAVSPSRPASGTETSESEQARVERDTLSETIVKNGTLTSSGLTRKAAAIIHDYGGTIRKYAKRYGIDWRLVLSVIEQESQFDPQAQSYRGAFGLMQLMPETGERLAVRLGLDSLTHPRDNIAAGVYYLWELSSLFDNSAGMDRVQLTLAAYNAGPARVLDAQEIAKYLGEDPNRWASVKSTLPLLSERYASLHQLVWGTPKPATGEGAEGRPKGGYFRNAEETINYVERVTNTYELYTRLWGSH